MKTFWLLVAALTLCAVQTGFAADPAIKLGPATKYKPAPKLPGIRLPYELGVESVVVQKPNRLRNMYLCSAWIANGGAAYAGGVSYEWELIDVAGDKRIVGRGHLAPLAAGAKTSMSITLPAKPSLAGHVLLLRLHGVADAKDWNDVNSFPVR